MFVMAVLSSVAPWPLKCCPPSGLVRLGCQRCFHTVCWVRLGNGVDYQQHLDHRWYSRDCPDRLCFDGEFSVKCGVLLIPNSLPIVIKGSARWTELNCWTHTYYVSFLPSVDQVETREGFALAPLVLPSLITIPEWERPNRWGELQTMHYHQLRYV
jgi:hypothetical protein